MHKPLSRDSNEGPLVLVVDDHEAVQHAIQHQLSALACRSAIAGTGEAALEQFASTAFDMVLLCLLYTSDAADDLYTV